MPPRGQAFFDEVLTREFERGFHRFRSAGDEVDVAEAFRRGIDEKICERFGGFGREEGCVRVGQLGGLLLDGFDHARMAVPETRYRRPAASIDVALTGGIDDFDPIAAHGDRQGGAR